MELVSREKLKIHLYICYVDDVRIQALAEGWRWVGNGFDFSTEWEELDRLPDKSDQLRTAEEIAKAMSSLVKFLSLRLRRHQCLILKNYPH